MAGFKFGIELDASRYKKGTDDAARATDDLADELADLERKGTSSLEDVGHAFGDISSVAKRTGDDIQDAVVDGTDEAARAASSLEQRFRDAMGGAGDSARTLSDDVADAAKDIKSAVEDNAITAQDLFKAELKAELAANMAEAGAEAIRGLKDGMSSEDWETIVDGLTDAMVSVGAIGGPVGIAAGLAGGAITQMLVGPMLADAEAKLEQFQETFSTAFAAIVENGAQLGRELSIAASVDEFAQDTEKMADATKLANAVGVERGVVLRAMAGDTEALSVVQERHAAVVDEGVAALDREAQQLATTGLVTEEVAAAADLARERQLGLQGALDSTTSSFETNTDALTAAKEAAAAKAEADNYAAEKAIVSAQAMAQSTGAAQDLSVTIDGVTRAFRVMPDGKVVEVTDGGSAERTQEEIDGISGTSVAVDAHTNNNQWQGAVDAQARRLRPPTIVVTPQLGMRAV